MLGGYIACVPHCFFLIADDMSHGPWWARNSLLFLIVVLPKWAARNIVQSMCMRKMTASTFCHGGCKHWCIETSKLYICFSKWVTSFHQNPLDIACDRQDQCDWGPNILPKVLMSQNNNLFVYQQLNALKNVILWMSIMGAGNGAPKPCGGKRSRLVTMPET